MDTKAKVIFVNSFKGGAGKTTLSLTYCIDNLFLKKEYENVVYMDLDILGTGTCYLFKEGALPPEKCFERTESAVEISLKYEKEEKSLYVAYLDPAAKMRFAYGDGTYVNHQGIAEEELREQFTQFIRDRLEEEVSTLIVLDCAPGFTRLEQAILQECYVLEREGSLEVQEDYVTTLDSSHVQKCIQCLNDSMKGIQRYVREREIRLVVNDLQNYTGYVEGELDENGEEKWKTICGKILEGLQNDAVTIIRWKYSRNLAQKSVFGLEGVVENTPGDYVFTKENFKILHGKKKEE